MVESIFGKKKQVVCDNCGDGFEAESWEEAQATMKELGWQTKRVNGLWVNYCETCKEATHHAT